MPARTPVVVIAPDKFKGSLSASAVAAAIERGLRRVWPHADLRARPMADGGDGTLDAILSRGGERVEREVSSASGARLIAPFGIVEIDGARTAVIESAQIVGMNESSGTSIPIERRSTRGVGELMLSLLDDGVRHFLIGIGGSNTSEGGAGMLAALGMRFIGARSEELEPTLEGLATLVRADATALDARVAESTLTIMSDVDNLLCGEDGATAVFGLQKGVDATDVARFDSILARYAEQVERATGRTAAHNPGAGAAGGLGFALQIAGGTLRSGAEVVADAVGLDRAIADAQWVITGEGRSDAQTLLRKAPWVIADKARAVGVPATLLSGALDVAALPLLQRQFAGCFALSAGPATLESSIANAASLLADRAEALAQLWDAAQPGLRQVP